MTGISQRELSLKNSIIYRVDTFGNKGFFNVDAYCIDLPHTPAKHVKHYATSAFEGILVIPHDSDTSSKEKGKSDEDCTAVHILCLDQHVDRLFRTMDSLFFIRPEHIEGKIKRFNELFPNKDPSMPIPIVNQKYLTITREEVKQAIIETIIRNVKAGHLDPTKLIYGRPNVYRDEKSSEGMVVPGLGVASLGHEVVLEIAAYNVGSYLASAPKDGARVVVFEKELWQNNQNAYYQDVVRGLQSPLRQIKSGANYGLGGVAKNLAIMLGCDEALITDPDNNVLEGGGENAFSVIDGMLRTPPKNKAILPGTKRALVLEISKKLGIPNCEEDIPLSEFINADAAAFSGTWCGFEPLGHLYWYSTRKESRYNSNNEIIQILKSEYNFVMNGDNRVDSSLKDIQERVRTKVEIR
ncbi:MAG TPA: hypothetical protein DCE80_10600 [Ignavibacteriales bacterium]|nr:aminotransferase class IV family protein [Candidatus Woesearchaeota archaeon]HAB52601.1 hypothetical protein [Ignavibacteriales bacterium]